LTKQLNINYIYAILYTIANLFLLLNIDGLYWDDWAMYNQEPQTIAIFFGMIHHGIKGEFYLVLSKFFNHIYLFRIFIFIAYALIGYFTYYILFSTKIFSKNMSKLIAFISVIIPIAPVKFYLSIAPFVFPVLIFYFAFYLLARNYPFANKSIKIIILFLFLCSFSTNSILVFYALVLLYLYYIDNDYTIIISLNKLIIFIKKHWDFILLPIFYFIYKSLFLKTYGLYENYNHIHLNFNLIINLLSHSIKVMTIDFMQYVLSNPLIDILAIAVALILALVLNVNFNITKKKIFYAFVFFIIMFILATFPYLAVGKMPIIEGVNSRFALLLGISLSMFTIFLSLLISYISFNDKYRNKIFIFIVSFFTILYISKNISQQYNFLVENFYKASLIQQIKKSKVIKNHTTFLVKSYESNSFYEWNGVLKKAFGNTKRFMVEDLRDINSYQQYRQYKQYNFAQWKFDGHLFLVNIKKAKKINFKDFVNLLYLQLTNHQAFENKVNNYISIVTKERKNVR